MEFDEEPDVITGRRALSTRSREISKRRILQNARNVRRCAKYFPRRLFDRVRENVNPRKNPLAANNRYRECATTSIETLQAIKSNETKENNDISHSLRSTVCSYIISKSVFARRKTPSIIFADEKIFI